MSKPTWTFSTAYVVSDEQIYVAASADSYEDFAKFTALYKWCPALSDGDPEANWRYKNVNWRATSVTALIPSEGEDWWLCAASEDGEIQLSNNGFSVEIVQGAGVHSETAGGWGYLSDLQQIGEHLYVAGYAGQVYKRLGPNQWIHFDEGILQSSGMQGGQYSVQVINGPHEEAIYVAGCVNAPYYPARASFWDGKSWQDIKLPEIAERITNLYIGSESEVWMCGANGTLLLGNAIEGFKSLSTVDDNQLFLSICKFHDLIYLGSNLGLFVYNPNEHSKGIRKVASGMTPEIQDANIVDSVDKFLWSIGSKDIARFDGVKWERIHHPDNAKI
jgi:hypothetical protein